MCTNLSDVVICGVAGRFPKSDDVSEYEQNLLNKVYMVDDCDDRVKWKFPNQPTKFGFIRNINKFDSQAFRMPPFLSKSLDPQGRILLEHVFEAVLDAGVCPNTLMGTNTGVYVGCFNYDSLDYWLFDKATRHGVSSVGNAAYALANRISFALGVHGPSITVDTACSASLYALTLAFNDIKNGTCDAAIVAGTNLILSPLPIEDFSRAGILAKNGISQPFDKHSCGYVRAEACCAIYLERAENAKRIYATVVSSKTNNDGFKRDGPMVPSSNIQKKLYESIYEDESIKIGVNSIDYIEAHATSTQVGDKQEIKSLDEYFCKDRKTPLKIGSVKSNLGHAEGAAAFTSLVKVLLMFENQRTYPNLNVTELRDDCAALVEKRIEIVQEVEDFHGTYIGLNSFGVLGANAHALLKRNGKAKVDNGFPKDDLPRLLTWSGRSKEAVGVIFDRVAGNVMDDEFMALLQSSQSQSMPACLSRGFGIFKTNSHDRSTVEIDRQIVDFDATERPIVFVYSGVGSQWLGMGKDLMKIPLIARRIDECHNILSAEGIDLKKIVTSDDPTTFSSCLNIFVGVNAIQIALTDLMNLIGIVPDFLIGHSVGELGCAYADGTLTMKETILTAYSRGLAINCLQREEGAMAAIGIGFKELRKIVPDDIEISCHNSSDSCTISGKIESVKHFVDEMKSKNVLAKVLDSAGVPFHSSYIAQSGPILVEKLKSIISSPKKRSKKWISTSVAKDKWEDEIAQWSSAEYHANNMLSPVLFAEGSLNLPEKSLVIEISPHGVLQPIVKQCLPSCDYVSLTKRDVDDGLIFILQSLGKIHQNGINIDIRQIYPKIEFPVSRGTAMISPLIKWNHSDNLFVPIYDPFTQCDKRSIFISLSDLKFNFMKGHQLDGRVILPATGYLYFVWETYAMMHSADMNDFPICFEEVKYLRATMLPKEHETELTINIQRGSGYFEIIDKTTTIASGIVKSGATETLTEITLKPSDDKGIDYSLNRDDFYKELRLRGYEFAYDFMSLDCIEIVNKYQTKGKIEWKSNWVTFTDCMLQSIIVNYDSRDLYLPTFIRKMVIDPKKHEDYIIKEVNSEERILIDVNGDLHLNCLRCGGVEIIGFRASFVTKFAQATAPTLQTYKFVPHFPTPILTKTNAARFCVQLLMEISPNLKVSIGEIDDGDEPLVETFVSCLDKVPLVMSQSKYFTKRENVEMKNVNVSSDELSANDNFDILIATNVLNDALLEKRFENILENGFLLSRETQLVDSVHLPASLQCIAVVTMTYEFVYIINRGKDIADEVPFTIPNDLENFAWVSDLKHQVTKKNTLLFSNGKFSGILGFFNCLKKEPRIKSLRSVFVTDDVIDKFELNDRFFSHQLSLGLPVNVYKYKKWGTYRHLDLPSITYNKSNSKHAFVNILTRGDVSSLTWVSGNLNLSRDNLIEVYFAALNYRDVLVATKRIVLDYEIENRIDCQYLCGYEFSGVTTDGRRVMGIIRSKAISNFVAENECLTMEIPDEWTLEDGATVLLVHVTVYLAFFQYTNIRKGKTILIHAGSGGLGLAAIRVAIGYGLKVFTTVSSEEKKNYLLNEFSGIERENIGNSRDTSFETMIMERTNGKGVDFVLNSLAEDKLQASIRCVADGGVFLEVGKFDMLTGNKISLNHFLRGITFTAVLLNLQNFMESQDIARSIARQIQDDIESGIIKPLKANVFAADEIQDAFRFIASSKHIGKVLINVKDHNKENIPSVVDVQPRLYFDKEKSYIIPGGLGGMGMEIIDFMILRECKKFVLSSSRGISNSYQTYRINLWKTYEDVEIVVTTADITTKEGCREVIKTALELGPVGGILNLAGKIDDKLFEKMTEKSFTNVWNPKALSTLHLDEVSRQLCPDLDHFVVFSSISCGYGNAGQTNYGFANSTTERIVEKRRADGLAGKAIQWGPVDDVGMMKNASDGKALTTFFGMIPQKINSCFNSLNNILMSDETIVSSVVVADKKISLGGDERSLEAMLIAMGFPDVKTIDRNKPILELGMDSIGGTEIQQTLEREFGITMTFQELRTKTLNQIEALIKGSKSNAKPNTAATFLDEMWKNINRGTTSENLIEELKFVEGRPKLLLIPGMISDMGDIWLELDYSIFTCNHGKFHCLQSFDELFKSIIGDVVELYNNETEFMLVGYSFGSMIALKICEVLESMGKRGNLISIDGSPSYIRLNVLESMNNQPTDEDLQNYIFEEFARSAYGAME
ncbi:Fatty acid synthase, partial [Pseudolycoriella hygida]